jgi:semaphorin 6
LRDTQRTEQYDLKQLNQPAFVNALEFNGYVFFFFREISGEFANCGKAVYSRVGRVCKNDKGGPYPFGNRWTSFLKSRLNCSVPGDYPFYFDEVQATTKIIEGLYNNQNDSIVYAIMNTPPNSIGGSAICAFSLYDIIEAFEGQFKEQRDLNSNWMPLTQEMVPEPRPGKCVDDSRTLPSVTVKFAKTHTLMETNVDAKYGRPVLSRVTLNYRFSAIVVDPQVSVLNGQSHDVLFVGTDNGRVIKFVNIVSANASEVVQAVVIAEHQVLAKSAKVTELTINHRTQKLIVVGQGQIVSIPLYSCDTVSRCCDCVSHQDPYCEYYKLIF